MTPDELDALLEVAVLEGSRSTSSASSGSPATCR